MKNKTRKIRRGGIATKHGYLYELTGGDPALDLANTVDNRPTENRWELIPSYLALLSWAKQMGILNRSEELRLRQQAEKFPKAAEKARKQTVSLRECLFEIFSNVADKRSASAPALRQFEAILRSAIHEHRLTQNQQTVSWVRNDTGLDSITWTVALSASNLLTSNHIHRLRRCAATNCDWLFLDFSKRGNRRWCDMTICGNRAKANRFYSRKKNSGRKIS